MLDSIPGLFSCRHQHLSFPITMKRERPTLKGPSKKTYVVCLDCGKQFPYDWESLGTAADPFPSPWSKILESVRRFPPRLVPLFVAGSRRFGQLRRNVLNERYWQRTFRRGLRFDWESLRISTDSLSSSLMKFLESGSVDYMTTFSNLVDLGPNAKLCEPVVEST